MISNVLRLVFLQLNPLHLFISLLILHTVLYTFPMVMKRRICLRIKGLQRVGEHFLFYDLDVQIRNDADASDIEKVISLVKYKGIALPNLKKYVLNS